MSVETTSSPVLMLNHADLLDTSDTRLTTSQLLSSLKRSTLTIHNRLKSIQADADFVSKVAQAYPSRPLVANERQGSWYVPPEKKQTSAYFKSTDGHERAWKFSTRRLNFHLLEMIEKNDGVIIVDSTRRGKKMPDALSTTVPIWCTVLNLMLLPEHPLADQLFLPPYMSASTHAQITALIPSFLSSLRDLKLALPTCLTKPLRPFWITQDAHLPEPDVEDEEDAQPDGFTYKRPEQVFEGFRPVMCCTASRRIVGSERDEAGYIQGAADDTENWSHGLTSALYWKHRDILVNAMEADVPSLIKDLIKRSDEIVSLSVPHERKKLLPHLYATSLPAPQDTEASLEGRVILTAETTPKESWLKRPNILEAGLGKHRSASRNLRTALPDICAFASSYFSSLGNHLDGEMIVACETGKDLSVGAVLAISCRLFDDEGNFGDMGEDKVFTKTFIRKRLGEIMTAYPEANPSRATLQAVNSYLMDWRRGN